jgi:RNA polymerase sigma-70 factor (ECF subfamily)
LRALAESPEARALVTRFAAARRDALAARASLDGLLALCRPAAEQIARTYTRSEADAADMAQEALIAVARFLPDLRRPEAFPHWLAAVAHNACRQWLRRERRHRVDRIGVASDADHPEGAVAWALADAEDPAAGTEFDLAAARDVLGRLMRTLPAREREIVRRLYLDDLPCRDAARRMDLAAKAAESLAYRALRRLRSVAGQCGDEWEELTLWCPQCGRHRLLGRLVPGNSPAWPLHVRAVCPGCRLSNYDMGLPLGRYPSLEIALVDGMAGLGAEVQEVVRSSVPQCASCGGLIALKETGRSGQVSWRCPRCSAGGTGGVECVAATMPAWRAFLLGTPHLRLGSTTEVTRGGERRLVLTAWDDASGRRATVAVAASTMEVRAVEVPA